jgi:predicted GIY-YIG superfamily endonuclease
MHPTYKRMLAGLKRKEKASLRRGKKAQRSGDRHPLTACPLTRKPCVETEAVKNWSLYILKCSDGSFYTGITNNLDRRLKMHQAGKASRYTRTRGPVEMLYSETCGNRSRALIRECEVKEWPRERKEKLIAGDSGLVPRSLQKRKPRTRP